MPENLILKSLLDAARILEKARGAVAFEPLPVFTIVMHALYHVNAQLDAEMRGVE